MLYRLETMVLMGMDLPLNAVRRQIASGIDIIIHLGRLRDKSRKVLSITEITGYEEGEIQMQTLYEYIETGQDAYGQVQGKLLKKAELKYRSKLDMAGIRSI